MAQSCQTKKKKYGHHIYNSKSTCVNLTTKKLSNKHAHKFGQGTEYFLQIKFYSFNSTKNCCRHIFGESGVTVSEKINLQILTTIVFNL